MNIRNYLFSNYLTDNEKIHYIAHTHAFILIKKVYKVVVLLVGLPIILTIIYPSLFLGMLILIFVGICGFLYEFGDWYLDAWIITNFGVIDVEVTGFFKRASKRVDYHMIEGIAYEIDGFFHTMFNFGDITIDKIGSKIVMTLKEASNPKNIERIILEHQKKQMATKSFQDHETLKTLLADMLIVHNKNKDL